MLAGGGLWCYSPARLLIFQRGRCVIRYMQVSVQAHPRQHGRLKTNQEECSGYTEEADTMYAEGRNDDYNYREVATQSDYDNF